MTALTPPRVTRQPDAGFTLVEVLIAMLLLSILMSALAGAVISSLKATAGTSTRLSTSHDRQLVQVYLPRDLSSASGALSGAFVTSWHCAPPAPAATPALVLTWKGMPPTSFSPTPLGSAALTATFEADYVAASTPSPRLLRYYCYKGPQSSSWSTAAVSTMVYGLQSTSAVTAQCASSVSGPLAFCNQVGPPVAAPWLTMSITDTTGASYSVTGQMRTNS